MTSSFYKTNAQHVVYDLNENEWQPPSCPQEEELTSFCSLQNLWVLEESRSLCLPDLLVVHLPWCSERDCSPQSQPFPRITVRSRSTHLSKLPYFPGARSWSQAAAFTAFFLPMSVFVRSHWFLFPPLFAAWETRSLIRCGMLSSCNAPQTVLSGSLKPPSFSDFESGNESNPFFPSKVFSSLLYLPHSLSTDILYSYLFG